MSNLYDERVPYAVEAIRTQDEMKNNSMLTDTAFMHMEDAMLFAKQLSAYTGVAFVFDQLKQKCIAKYVNGVIIS